MSHVFRFIGTRQASNEWDLGGDEAHHVAKVLRLAPGTVVEVCDGAGLWSVGTIAEVASSGKTVRIATDGALNIDKAPAWPLWICVGALKPGSVDELLPSLVELGADAVHVFQQEGGAKSRLAGSAVERWQRISAGAIKQCKRARLPAIVVHQSAEALAAAVPRAMLRLVMDPDGAETLTRALSRGVPAAGAALVVGGEKGLSPAEAAALAAAGFSSARLGGYVLRAYTAALAACSVGEAVRLS